MVTIHLDEAVIGRAALEPTILPIGLARRLVELAIYCLTGLVHDGIIQRSTPSKLRRCVSNRSAQQGIILWYNVDHRKVVMEFSRKKIAQFQDQECPLTLKEAVAEFYEVNSESFSPPEPKTIWTSLLVHHDVGHVFFGINTTIMDEAAGDCWIMMGSDMQVKEYRKYAATPEGKQLIKDIGPYRLAKCLLLSIPTMIKIFILSRKMSMKWQTEGYEKYMNTPLSEVRRLHNLKILKY